MILDPTVFADMWYMKSGDQHYRKLAYNTLQDIWGSDNESEWGFSWDTITTTQQIEQIRIWDNYPLPD